MSLAEIKPITPNLGAEVTDVSLATALDDDRVIAQLQEALLAHHVLVFRDQQLDREQHKAFGRLFGTLHVHPSKRGPDVKGDPEIFSVKADENTTRNNGGRWHADVTCDDVPPLGSILHLKHAPPHGGDTMFANMHLAFDTLSEPIQQLLLGLDARHDGLQDLRWYGFEPEPGFSYPATTHPVVVAHPDTERPLLFVNEAFTSRIAGLSDHESDALLAMLFDHIARTPSLQCRVRWDVDTVVFWDNRSVQHLAVWDYYPHTRRGERVTVSGTERPRPVAGAAGTGRKSR